MKFKTFRALAVGGLAVVIAALAVGLGSLRRDVRRAVDAYSAPAAQPVPTAQPAQPAAPQAAPPPALPARPAPGPGQEALRPMDEDILALLAKPMGGDKIKDAFSSRSYKVNIYKDAGFASANRLKIDLDRDEKDDEKWTIEGQGAAMSVKRQLSPGDDGNYPVEYMLVGGGWTKK